ncbi:hypothetical protein SARC_10392 [Sphaeroforma arctica JP610]|uniref:Uncharacterized protein n=1 Tax=Sphaeroforma arctica JP610 TaxID=667725 RepID=A0A0L0FK64_9EUKA|nr:hypothetical protein SARC_10392 [Sphaeroforma arctica JP610]KNC77140.1 hypothetical protein SARC_10392 [Sphaeroforma arctica JP610]|eukprot:XP_014151042.1 hypothetical protein SARC_10392 [Sphaeroforma arctica JP610]
MQISLALLLVAGIPITVAAVETSDESELCNPLLLPFVNMPGNPYSKNLSMSIINNPHPVMLGNVEGMFRCTNVNSSCCTAVAMDELRTKFNVERQKLIDTAENIRNLTAMRDVEVNELQSGLDKAIDDVKGFLDSLPFQSEDPVETRLKELSNVLKSMMVHTRRWIQETLTAYGRCLDRTLEYNAGLMCLACNTDWTKYISYNKTTGLTLRLSSNTCDTFDHGCRGIWQAATKYMKALREDAQDARNIANHTEPLPDVLSESQICGNKPCRELVCSDMMKGLVYHAPLAHLALVLNHTSSEYDSFNGTGIMESKSRRGLPAESQRQYSGAVSKASRKIADVAAAMSKITPFTGLAMQFGSNKRRKQVSEEVYYTAEYVDGGYYATDAGRLYAQGVETESKVEGVAVCPDPDNDQCNRAFSVSPAISTIACLLIAKIAAI